MVACVVDVQLQLVSSACLTILAVLNVPVCPLCLFLMSLCLRKTGTCLFGLLEVPLSGPAAHC